MLAPGRPLGSVDERLRPDEVGGNAFQDRDARATDLVERIGAPELLGLRARPTAQSRLLALPDRAVF